MSGSVTGMLEGRDGKLFSYGYELWNGRVFHVFFFDALSPTVHEHFFQVPS